jgi:DNA-binding beta-propeller fold protein YncE
MKISASLCVLSSILLFTSYQTPQEGKPEKAPAKAEATEGVTTLVAELPGGTGGMEVDAEGFVYSADFGSKLGAGSEGGNLIMKIYPVTGKYEIFTNEMRGASGNAIGPSGDFFQSNIGANTISRITPDGKVSSFLKQQLQNPVGIIIDEDGILFVANCGGGRILEVTPDGGAAELCKSPLLKCPNGIALDEEHNLYVCNFSNGDVIKITPGGEASKFATLPGNNNGHVVYRDEMLYVVARSAHQIYKVSLEGEIELFAGSGKRGNTDGSLLESTFSFPNDLAFSPDGSVLYVNMNARIEGPGTELAPVTVRAINMPKAKKE